MADERCLPAGHEDLNITLIKKEFLDYVGVLPENIHIIRGENGAHSAAEIYLLEMSNVPSFDLVLLGIGDDGHTASLFPGHDIDKSHNAPEVIPVFNSPKYPSERVSLSLSKINSSKKVIFLVTGEKKRKIVNSFSVGEMMPATLVKGRCHTSLFYCPEC